MFDIKENFSYSIHEKKKPIKYQTDTCNNSKELQNRNDND